MADNRSEKARHAVLNTNHFYFVALYPGPLLKKSAFTGWQLHFAEIQFSNLPPGGWNRLGIPGCRPRSRCMYPDRCRTRAIHFQACRL